MIVRGSLRDHEAHAQVPGPYANAVLRFQIDFPADYPDRPPVLRFLSDLFHPLVTPLTTYTHSTRDTGSDTVSAADENRLPPGGLSLRHGFPEWFDHRARDVAAKTEAQAGGGAQSNQLAAGLQAEDTAQGTFRPPHVVELLQYLCIIFDTESALDAIPLEAAGNTGAWHAWKTFRSRASSSSSSSSRATSVARSLGATDAETRHERSVSPQKRQQPGGARRPGEWNWQGVWEERVRRSVQASQSEAMLFGGDNNDVVGTAGLCRADIRIDVDSTTDQFPQDGSRRIQSDLTFPVSQGRWPNIDMRQARDFPLPRSLHH